MAIFRPFRAWRYVLNEKTEKSNKFSPLFDVVNEEQLEKLYSLPKNSIHLSVPHSHEKAVRKLEEWKTNKTIDQDTEPCFYLYYQHFFLYGDQKEYTRKGLVGMLRMESPDNEAGIILHENTISSSVKERTELLEKTLLNVAPTHGLFMDEELVVEKILDKYALHPELEYVDYQGVKNVLAKVDKEKDIRALISFFRKKKLYLADGHHRFGSSLLYARQQDSQSKREIHDPMENYHMIFLSNLASDDLKILPIHRVIKGVDQKDLIENVTQYFNLTEITNNKSPVYLELSDKENSFGLIMENKQYLIELKKEFSALDIPLNIHPEVKKIPYTILHYYFLEKVLGIPYNEQRDNDNITYQKDYYLAVKAPIEVKNTIALICPGLEMEQMVSVSNSGAVMPQKSTYFYPKIVCGLLFGSIDNEENKTAADLSFQFTKT